MQKSILYIKIVCYIVKKKKTYLSFLSFPVILLFYNNLKSDFNMINLTFD